MIIDFLTANLRRRTLHGQPLVFDRIQKDFAERARYYENLTPEGQVALRPDLGKLRERSTGKPTAILVRPKLAVHVEAAKEDFEVVVIDDVFANSYESQSTLSIVYWQYLVSKALEAEAGPSTIWIQRLIDEMTELVLAINPKIVLVSSDVHYTERTVALVAKTLNIPVVNIQNGLFSGYFEPTIHDGESSDYFIAWSEYTKQFLVRAGNQKEEEILISGYPYPVTQLPARPSAPKGAKTVVFLGQPFEAFQPEQSEAKKNIAEQVYQSCQALGLNFLYRPHPHENIASLDGVIPEQLLLAKTQPLVDVFRQYGAFVSLTSSALVEASLHGRVAIQVYDSIFQSENLGEVGACHSCDWSKNGIDTMLGRLKGGELKPVSVDPYFLPTTPDVKERFTDLYRSFLNHWSTAARSSTKSARFLCLANSFAPNPNAEAPAKPFEGFALLSPSSPVRTVSASLNLEEAARNLQAIRRLHPDEALTVSGELAFYAAPFLSSVGQVEVVAKIEPPPSDPYQCVVWLHRLSALFGSRQAARVSFVDVDSSTILSPNPVVAHCALVFSHMRSRLSGDPALDVLKDAATICQNAYRFALDYLNAQNVDDLQTAYPQTNPVGLLNLTLTQSAELEAIRSSKLWKLWEKFARLKRRR